MSRGRYAAFAQRELYQDLGISLGPLVSLLIRIHDFVYFDKVADDLAGLRPAESQ